MDTVYIHADESCLGNQFQDRETPGGAGGLVEIWKDGRWERRDYWISEPDTTNNRMAIRSAIEALRGLKRPCDVRFVSDSQYLVKGLREWLDLWKRNGWRRKAGPIENLELWKQLDAERERHRIQASWVRGHDKHPENEYCDFLATRAAKEQSDSNGLVPSGFEAWLARHRDKGRFLSYVPSLSPSERFG
jgi:ribonuclease HI